MAHCLDGCGHMGWSHDIATVQDHYATDGRVAEAGGLDMAERRARATHVVTQVTPSALPTRILVPRGVRGDRNA